MPDRQPTRTRNLDRDGGTPLPWERARSLATAGPATRKARHLTANPACAIAVKLPGMDLTLEGQAARTTQPQTLETVAALYRDLGWPARVRPSSA